MSEIEETYTIQEPTLTEQVHALVREVDHVTEQLKVEHAQIFYWKTRALQAERALETLQKASGRTQGKPGLSGRGQTSDGLHGSPSTTDDLL